MGKYFVDILCACSAFFFQLIKKKMDISTEYFIGVVSLANPCSSTLVLLVYISGRMRERQEMKIS